MTTVNLISLSIVTPCFNEELTVKECYLRTKDVMASKLPDVAYEHIFIDNSSTDQTIGILHEIKKSDSTVKLYVNSRNIGPFRSIYRGIKKSKGLSIIPMLPADLQDPPEVIPEFYNLWAAGNLVVFGERKNRQESIWLRSLRAIYYRTIRLLASYEIPLNVGEFMIIDRKIANAILETQDEYPYVRGLVAQSFPNAMKISYTWHKRKLGKSKSKPFDLIDQGINGLISTSRVPARIALFAGFAFSFLGILLGIWTFFVSLFADVGTENGIPTLIVGLFLFGGLQLFFLGLIGEYVLSMHSQIKRSPPVFDVDQV